MRKKHDFNRTQLEDAIQQTLKQEYRSIHIYDWMLKAELKGRYLLVYATIFDDLRKEPQKPKNINHAAIARRLHTTRNNVLVACNKLVEEGFLHHRSSSKFEHYYSLYPIQELF